VLDLSVILCTYNRAESLRKTLNSFSSVTVDSSIRWELIVVDNNSTDPTPEICEQFKVRTPLTYCFEPKQGLSCARNRGIEEAQGKLIVFTDDDVDVDPNWMNALCAGAQRYPEAGFFGGPIYAKWESPPPAWLARHASDLLCGLAVQYDRGKDDPFLKEGEASFIGANMMFRKQVFEAGIRFREDIGRKGGDLTGLEDTVFIGSLLKAGYRGVFIPEAKIFHRNPKERMTEQYLRKWYIGAGRGLYRVNPVRYNQYLFFGTPRFLWRKLIFAALQYILTRWLCLSKLWVPAECEMALTWGKILEYREDRGTDQRNHTG